MSKCNPTEWCSNFWTGQREFSTVSILISCISIQSSKWIEYNGNQLFNRSLSKWRRTLCWNSLLDRVGQPLLDRWSLLPGLTLYNKETMIWCSIYLLKSSHCNFLVQNLNLKSNEEVQIKAKGRDAYRSRGPIAFFDFSVSIRIPLQQLAFTRVMHAVFIRIALFWESRLDRIWMNLAQTWQTWRVSWGLHTLGADITKLGTIKRMRKPLRFILFVDTFDFGSLFEFLTVFKHWFHHLVAHFLRG